MNARIALSIAIAVLSVWASAATQLDPLVGPTISKIITAASSLTVASLAAVLGVLSGQGSQVSSVAAMPGVERIIVNDKATPALASLAVSEGSSAKIVAENDATKNKLTQIVANS